MRKPSLGNAFSMIAEPVFDFWPKKVKFSTSFIRFSGCPSVRHWFYALHQNARKKQYSIQKISARSNPENVHKADPCEKAFPRHEDCCVTTSYM